MCTPKPSFCVLVNIVIVYRLNCKLCTADFMDRVLVTKFMDCVLLNSWVDDDDDDDAFIYGSLRVPHCLHPLHLFWLQLTDRWRH
eukprot:SAG11_NODE_5030_length_1685_cov_7.857503_2_plen_85_part_00